MGGGSVIGRALVTVPLHGRTLCRRRRRSLFRRDRRRGKRSQFKFKFRPISYLFLSSVLSVSHSITTNPGGRRNIFLAAFFSRWGVAPQKSRGNLNSRTLAIDSDSRTDTELNHANTSLHLPPVAVGHGWVGPTRTLVCGRNRNQYPKWGFLYHQRSQ